jgi:hypothetical protein
VAKSVYSFVALLLTISLAQAGEASQLSLSARKCTSSIRTECWGSKEGTKFYVTPSGIRVSESCFSKPTENYVKAWDPDYFVGQVEEMIHQQDTCLSGLNPDAVATIKSYIAENKPMIRCFDPEKADFSGDACGFADLDTHEIDFIRTQKCGFVASTLFHEMLHLIKFDNLPTNLHNDNGCIPFDSVFTCTRMCFPAETFMQGIERDGCEACIGTPDKHERCSKYPRHFTNEYVDCVQSIRAPASHAGPKRPAGRHPGN